MDKLDEREPATRSPLAAAPALAVQFFLIPLTVVAVTVSVYVGFRSLLADDRSPTDYLSEIRNGGSARRCRPTPSRASRTRWTTPTARRALASSGRSARRATPTSCRS